MSTLGSSSDNDLLLLLREGEQAAFTEIYNRYWKLLYKTAVNILEDGDAAQDIVQNIFVSLWQRRAEVHISVLKPYLQQATRFGVFKAIRAEQTDKTFYARLAEVTADMIADDPLIFKEQQSLLKELIDGLPEDCREAFRLSREESLTYKQIAALLGISEKTVEKRMSKSLKHIREGLSLAMCVAVICAVSKL
jgi:RNA polymerase sigma-70 factor (family 1)